METRSVTKQTAGGSHATLRLGSALLLCASLLGCVDSMSLGGSPYDECTKDVTCSDMPIELNANASGVSARASGKLSPLWSKSVAGQKMVKSASGGVWLISTRESSVVLVKVSEAGEVGAEVVVAGLPPLPNTTSRGKVTVATFHPMGPVVQVEWDHFSPPDFECPGNTYGRMFGDDAPPGTLCHLPTPQVFVFDEANLAAPTLVDPCERHDSCEPMEVLRSGDGASLLVMDRQWVRYQSLAGDITTREKLPIDLWGIVGAITSADGWSLLGSGGGGAYTGGGTAALVSARRDLPVQIVGLTGIDDAEYGTGPGFLFPGAQPGQLIAVVESAAPSDPQVQSFRLQHSGDLSVLRIEGEQLKSQQVFKREDYSPIELLAAGADDVGNAFVVTATGGRDATLAKTLTPLLCRAKAAGDSVCFELPATPSELQATRENVVFVRSGDVLSRFDIAP